MEKNSDDSNEPYEMSWWLLGREVLVSEVLVWAGRLGVVDSVEIVGISEMKNFGIETMTQKVCLETLGKFLDHTPLKGTN